MFFRATDRFYYQGIFQEQCEGTLKPHLAIACDQESDGKGKLRS